MSNEMMIKNPVVIPYSDMERMATVIAQSGLFGVKHPVQALALMLVAQSEGLHPASAARDYHVIQGRPTLKTDAMLARFQAAGGKVQWHEYTDAVVSATFSHPSGGSVKIDWTFERAKTAGLTGKEVWKQYPRAMLRARVISEGIRTVYPGVLSGMYTPEEVRDMAPELDPEPSPTVVVSPPVFDVDAAELTIAGFTDVNDLRIWLAGERRRFGWNKDDMQYKVLKTACAERAETIKQQASAINVPVLESVNE